MQHNGQVSSSQGLDEAERERIARRYPPPRIGRTGWIAIIAVLALIAGGTYLWIASFHGNEQVGGSVRGFQTHPDRVDAVIDVYRPDPSRPATCEVFALAENFERVGEVTQLIEPSEANEATVEVTILTYRRSTAVDVEDCEAL
ncbi:uncharacterized protein DUF4307 [Naumannella halotolerans]|uniref:Uncharacterized protein DUF4307 n=1 Tax=Naumannella halotolerans TaxID=993414 RepID=A0A4R7J7T8_9ACTN|nr:uncharacterized protein DUF4307 [Naumannella halotolerans]